MRFEQRTADGSAVAVSPDWGPACQLLLEGKSHDAWKLATGNRRAGRAPETPDDWLTAIEISRANGRAREYFALAKLALRAHPEQPLLQVYWGRALLSRGLLADALDYLENHAGAAREQLPALWGAEVASTYGSAGLRDSCLRALEQAGDPGEDPNLLYIHSCGFTGLREWDQSIELAQRALAVAPRWQRLRAYLCHCLLARGRVDDAAALITEGNTLGLEDALFDITQSMLVFSLGQFDAARIAYSAFLDLWPRNDYTHMVHLTLFLLLLIRGDLQEARAMRDRVGDTELPEIVDEQGDHHFIPLTLIAQSHNQCVPTTVAMALRAQGHAGEPEQMFDEMGGREGTAMWRMRDWVQQRGLRTIAIDLDLGAIKALLRAGVPLIGTLHGPFNSHVDVLCGFDERLDVFYVRDPNHWTPGAIPQELVLKRYEAEGSLIAIIDPANTAAVAIAEGARSASGEALLDLAAAIGAGDRTAAERAFAQVPPDTPAAAQANQASIKVVVTPRQFAASCEAVLGDPELPPVTRFQALMSLRGEEHRDEIDKFIDQHQDILGSGGTRFLKLQKQMQDSRWHEALATVDRLLRRSISTGNLWVAKAEILAELGDAGGSDQALARAIELMPKAVWLRERALQQNASQLTWDRYLAEFDRLIAEDPAEKSLLWGRMLALQSGPDGAAFEAAAGEYLHWFPRDPAGYLVLAQWYAIQGNDAFADQTIRAGRALVDPEELPWETSDELKTSDQETGDSSGPDGELPTEREELFGILGAPGDPRWRSARRQLEQLQADGYLKWDEVAKLCSARLIFGEDGKESISAAEVPGVFPVPLPGPPHWFAGLVADVATSSPLRPGTAAALGTWMDEVVAGIESWQSVWFQRILLLEIAEQKEKARQAWAQFIQRYPEASEAHYRLGRIQHQQSDFPAAIALYKRALETNPGLPGAMDNLLECASIVGDEALEDECLQRLQKKFPHNFAFLKQRLLRANHKNPASAEQMLTRHAPNLTENKLAILKALLALGSGNARAAEVAIAPLGNGAGMADSDFEEFLKVKLQLASLAQNIPAIRKLYEDGLQRWPDSVPLKERLAHTIADSDPKRARELLDEVFATPDGASPQTAFEFLSLARGNALDEATKAIEAQADERQRELAAECFTQAMSHPDFAASHGALLEWCRRQFPDHTGFTAKLVLHENTNNRSDRAIQLAHELIAREPNNPHWAYLLGRVQIDRSPKEALANLEAAYQRDRAGRILYDLARCHQILGNTRQSIEFHWKNLAQNPLASASLTALHLQGAAGEDLWRFIGPMLQAEAGIDDEYFHVATVMIAKDLDRVLPEAWVVGAVERYRILQNYPGFGDECPRMDAALAAWNLARPADLAAPQPGFFKTLRIKFKWPGLNWIPD